MNKEDRALIETLVKKSRPFSITGCNFTNDIANDETLKLLVSVMADQTSNVTEFIALINHKTSGPMLSINTQDEDY